MATFRNGNNGEVLSMALSSQTRCRILLASNNYMLPETQDHFSELGLIAIYVLQGLT